MPPPCAHLLTARALARRGEDISVFYGLRHRCGTWMYNVLRCDALTIAHQYGHNDGGKLAAKLYIKRDEQAA